MYFVCILCQYFVMCLCWQKDGEVHDLSICHVMLLLTEGLGGAWSVHLSCDVVVDRRTGRCMICPSVMWCCCWQKDGEVHDLSICHVMLLLTEGRGGAWSVHLSCDVVVDRRTGRCMICPSVMWCCCWQKDGEVHDLSVCHVMLTEGRGGAWSVHLSCDVVVDRRTGRCMICPSVMWCCCWQKDGEVHDLSVCHVMLTEGRGGAWSVRLSCDVDRRMGRCMICPSVMWCCCWQKDGEVHDLSVCHVMLLLTEGRGGAWSVRLSCDVVVDRRTGRCMICPSVMWCCCWQKDGEVHDLSVCHVMLLLTEGRGGAWSVRLSCDVVVDRRTGRCMICPSVMWCCCWQKDGEVHDLSVCHVMLTEGRGGAWSVHLSCDVVVDRRTGRCMICPSVMWCCCWQKDGEVHDLSVCHVMLTEGRGGAWSVRLSCDVDRRMGRCMICPSVMWCCCWQKDGEVHDLSVCHVMLTEGRGGAWSVHLSCDVVVDRRTGRCMICPSVMWCCCWQKDGEVHDLSVCHVMLTEGRGGAWSVRLSCDVDRRMGRCMICPSVMWCCCWQKDGEVHDRSICHVMLLLTEGRGGAWSVHLSCDVVVDRRTGRCMICPSVMWCCCWQKDGEVHDLSICHVMLLLTEGRGGAWSVHLSCDVVVDRRTGRCMICPSVMWCWQKDGEVHDLSICHVMLLLTEGRGGAWSVHLSCDVVVDRRTGRCMICPSVMWCWQKDGEVHDLSVCHVMLTEGWGGAWSVRLSCDVVVDRRTGRCMICPSVMWCCCWQKDGEVHDLSVCHVMLLLTEGRGGAWSVRLSCDVVVDRRTGRCMICPSVMWCCCWQKDGEVHDLSVCHVMLLLTEGRGGAWSVHLSCDVVVDRRTGRCMICPSVMWCWQKDGEVRAWSVHLSCDVVVDRRTGRCMICPSVMWCCCWQKDGEVHDLSVCHVMLTEGRGGAWSVRLSCDVDRRMGRCMICPSVMWCCCWQKDGEVHDLSVCHVMLTEGRGGAWSVHLSCDVVVDRRTGRCMICPSVMWCCCWQKDGEVHDLSVCHVMLTEGRGGAWSVRLSCDVVVDRRTGRCMICPSVMWCCCWQKDGEVHDLSVCHVMLLLTEGRGGAWSVHLSCDVVVDRRTGRCMICPSVMWCWQKDGEVRAWSVHLSCDVVVDRRTGRCMICPSVMWCCCWQKDGEVHDLSVCHVMLTEGRGGAWSVRLSCDVDRRMGRCMICPSVMWCCCWQKDGEVHDLSVCHVMLTEGRGGAWSVHLSCDVVVDRRTGRCMICPSVMWCCCWQKDGEVHDLSVCHVMLTEGRGGAWSVRLSCDVDRRMGRCMICPSVMWCCCWQKDGEVHDLSVCHVMLLLTEGRGGAWSVRLSCDVIVDRRTGRCMICPSVMWCYCWQKDGEVHDLSICHVMLLLTEGRGGAWSVHLSCDVVVDRRMVKLMICPSICHVPLLLLLLTEGRGGAGSVWPEHGWPVVPLHGGGTEEATGQCMSSLSLATQLRHI